MKKLFALLSIIALLTACNNGTEEKAETVVDSLKTESPLMDAVNIADSAGKVIEAAKDTALKVIEEVKK